VTHAHNNLDTVDLAVDGCLDRMIRAWDRGDAAAYAREFTADASYVIYVGLSYSGRDEIERAHVPVFERYQRGSRMTMRILRRSTPAPGVHIVTTEGGVGTGKKINRDKIQTFTMVRTDNGWRCAAFQNTKMNGLFIRLNALTERIARRRPGDARTAR
jgi:uncharacterized protein (TIGR02246 family)